MDGRACSVHGKVVEASIFPSHILQDLMDHVQAASTAGKMSQQTVIRGLRTIVG